jgi:hypothetical protein
MTARKVHLVEVTENQPVLAPIRDAGIVQMTPAQWAAVPEHPRQRNTAARSRLAKHLMALHPTHAKVDMVMMPDGRRFKVNGHTRSYLWQNGAVLPPPTLDVQCWIAETYSAVLDLYVTFDSKEAVESPMDRMYGAVREQGFEFQSDLLKSNRFATSMLRAHEFLFGQSKGTTYAMVEYWKPELRLLDRCGPDRKRYLAGVGGAALCTLRRYGPEAIEFWTKYSENAGLKLTGEMDPVQALDERITGFVRAKQTVGQHHQIKMLMTALSAFERYRRGEMYSSVSTGIKAMKKAAADDWAIRATQTVRTW